MKPATRQHPMAVVTRRTGLRPDVIRAWERRHRAVRPSRSAGNHRLYTDADIRRLVLLRRVLDAGWQIGQVAALPDAEIERLLADLTQDAQPSAAERTKPRGARLLARCLRCIREMDQDGLQRELEAASIELGRVDLLEDLLAPLLRRVGEACAKGTLRIAHEHLTSAAVRSFVDSLRAAYPVSETAPAVVVTTPAHQHHELAAMLVAATARCEGWKAIYLGPNLPAEEIAAAAARPGVRVLALSLTFDADDPALEQELLRIGRSIPETVRLVVGGRAAHGYLGVLESIGATVIAGLTEFRGLLARERGRQ